jgi:hypothetical protein
MQLKQVLQQPYARHTMNRRDVKGYPRQLLISEIDESTFNFGLIQVRPLIILVLPDADSGVRSQVEKMSQATRG